MISLTFAVQCDTAALVAAQPLGSCLLSRILVSRHSACITILRQRNNGGNVKRLSNEQLASYLVAMLVRNQLGTVARIALARIESRIANEAAMSLPQTRGA